VARNRLVKHIWGRGLESDSVLVHAEALLVPHLGEVVGIVDEAGTAPDSNGRAALDVARFVVGNFAHVHAGAVGKDGGLGKSLSFEELGEGVVSRVRLVNFLDLDSVITEEIVETEVFVTTIVGAIFPKNGERKHAAIVIQETFKVLVGAATLQLDF